MGGPSLSEVQRLSLPAVLKALEAELSSPEATPTAKPEGIFLSECVRGLGAALAARYLAVERPRSLGLLEDTPSLRWIFGTLYPDMEIWAARAVGPELACAADIVVADSTTPLDPLWIAEGTHLDVVVGHPLANAFSSRTASSLQGLVSGRAAPRQGAEVTCFEHGDTWRICSTLQRKLQSARDENLTGP